jgi:hypothetical protein
MQTYKPGSVESYHLSRPVLTKRLKQPTHPAGIKTSSFLCKTERDLFGLSTRGVYPRQLSPATAVSSYLTFSPLPRQVVAVIFCGTFRFRIFTSEPFPLGSALLCVARTFLFPVTRKAIEQSAIFLFNP